MVGYGQFCSVARAVDVVGGRWTLLIARERLCGSRAARLSGATTVATKRVVGPAYAPPPYHLVSDVSSPTFDTLKACATSDSGKEALAHAKSISSGARRP